MSLCLHLKQDDFSKCQTINQKVFDFIIFFYGAVNLKVLEPFAYFGIFGFY